MKCLLEIYDGRSGFYQWDVSQRLIVHDETITQVHFSNKGMTHSLVTEVYVDSGGNRVCSVPDIILQINRTLIAYAYLKNENVGETLYQVKFNVTPREIPDDYVYNQDAEIDKLDDRVKALEDKVGDGTVDDRIAAAKVEVIGGAPENLNTLNKIANSLNNDANFAKNIQDKLNEKVDKEVGKGLSENDFTNFYKDRADNAVQYNDVEQVFNPLSDKPQSGVAIAAELNKKVDKVDGKQLSTNDFTNELKNKLDKIQDGATNIVIDKTLTKPNQAADAETVGKVLDTKQPVGDYIKQNEIADWAKQSEKPEYTFDEVGAEQSGTVANKIAEHNKSEISHADIRKLIQDLQKHVDAILDSGDINLDQLSEIVAYIKNNKDLIDQITTNKVNVSDIINDLIHSQETKKPLSAAMGYTLKELIDELTLAIPKNKVVYQPEAPTDTSLLWVDTDDNESDGQMRHSDLLDRDKPNQHPIEAITGLREELNAGTTGMGLTGAKVGQIAKITAVDPQGIPTEWEPVDMPSGGGEMPWELLFETTTTQPVGKIDTGIKAPDYNEFYVAVAATPDGDGVFQWVRVVFSNAYDAWFNLSYFGERRKSISFSGYITPTPDGKAVATGAGRKMNDVGYTTKCESPWDRRSFIKLIFLGDANAIAGATFKVWGR